MRVLLRRIVRLEARLCRESNEQSDFDVSMLSDDLMRRILEAEGVISQLSETDIAALLAARRENGGEVRG